ncbi:MAG: hypothetical protein WBL23_10615 [Salinisphaera sp.]
MANKAYVAAPPQNIGGQSDLASWVLVLGGVGIVFGLATYGYQAMK